jgi:hypothetical protein
MNAQPSNDICGDAIQITDLDNNCTLYNFANATFDLRNGICAPAFARNVWFSFEAIGTDIEIEVTNNDGPNTFITLYELLPPACSPSTTFEIGCDTNKLELENVLSIGATYYISIAYKQNYQADYLMCVNNPEINLDPLNDYRCFARPVEFDNQCYDGTTENATFDLNNPFCTFADIRSVWYRGIVGSGKNRLEVNLSNQDSLGEIAVFIGQYPNNDCTEPINILEGACFDSSGQVTFTGLLPGQTYYLMVSHQDGNEQDFEICFVEKGPVNGCAVNDFCNTAELIVAGTDSGEVCVSGCNQGASFGPTNLTGCYFMNNPTVWYHIKTDELAGFLRLDMQSDSLRFPQLAVYQGDCNTLDTIMCQTGNGGRTNFFIDVIPETDYFIAATDVAGLEGVFDLCFEVLSDPQECVVQDTLYALSTSFGSPLEGPYQTGETVTFFYQISLWNKDNCNKLSGIVPFFGPGWDPLSFNADRQPTVIEPPINVSSGDWSWFPAGAVRYNYNNPGRGYLKGSALPSGYYFVSPPVALNDPNNSRGDGNGCETDSSNTWTFIFQVTTFENEDCPIGEEIPASVKIETFSDSETGTGQYRGCLLNESARIAPTVSCCEAPNLTISPTNRNLCSGSSARLDFRNRNDLEEVIWKVKDDDGIISPDDGSGLLFSQQIFLVPGITNGSVTFTFFPKDTTGCIGDGIDVTWDIYPTLEADAGPDKETCEGSNTTIGGTPTAIGGFGTGYIYNWSGGLMNEANPQFEVEEGVKTYFLNVSDPVGCTARDTVTVRGLSKPSVNIIPIENICAGQERTLTVEFQGVPPFDWSIEAGNFLSESFSNYSRVNYSTPITASNSFVIEVELNSDSNCPANDIYRDTVEVDPAPVGETDIILCNGGSIEIDGQVFDQTGDYEVLLQGAGQNGCDSILMLDLDVLSPIVIQDQTIEFDEDNGKGFIKVVIAGGLPSYEYSWSNGGSTDSIGNLDPGTYSLTVTDRNDCQAMFEFTLTTAVNNPLLSVLEAYPNPIPVNEQLTLQPEPQFVRDIGRAQWISQQGKVVPAVIELSEQKLHIRSPETAGLYHLRLIDGKGKAIGSIQVVVIDP